MIRRKCIGAICGAYTVCVSRAVSSNSRRSMSGPNVLTVDEPRRSPAAAFIERSRIVAAPRFETSSILRSVYMSSARSMISATWSVVIASTPHPKELSCTRWRSGCLATMAADSYNLVW